MENILLIVIIALFILFIISAVVSIAEKEYRAAKRFFIVSLLFIVPIFINTEYQFIIGMGILSILSIFVLITIIPFGKNSSYRHIIPSNKIDERDTMFSRNELEFNTVNYEDYYKRNPDKEIIDSEWRKKPGLLGSSSKYYHPFHFASSESSFETIGAFQSEVKAVKAKERKEVNSNEISDYIKHWAIKLGANKCGITELKDYHIYSTGGRGDRYGKQYVKQHKYAIAITVEMDHQMLQSAPKASIVMESGQQYLNSGTIAVQLAKFIGKLGYDARAHIDGNYEVVCPLVARDAGLGEIGRMGLLMTSNLGPRVRIAVVTTNIPLNIDQAKYDYSMIDFCVKCKKCADSCPSQAISFNDRELINGDLRWQINQEACFSLWASLGTDCGRCVSVCPFSHPDNLLHNVVRKGISNSSVFRLIALKMDDAIYGRRPHSAKLPKWM